jgi:hypothetical protein
MREHRGWHLLDYQWSAPKTRLLIISGYLTSAEMAKLFWIIRSGFIDKIPLTSKNW